MSPLSAPGTPARPGPRERLLAAARELTYSQGVHVGIDAILERAEVARRSMYQHFSGKDQLIAEVLRSAGYERRYRAALDSGGDDPRQRLLGIFDAIEAAVASPRFRGCRYTAAELSLRDPDHPAHAEVRAHKQWVHELLRNELERLGHPAPELAATQLVVLIDGVFVQAVIHPEVRPAAAARALAETVLAGAER